jgi:hypothetical protein
LNLYVPGAFIVTVVPSIFTADSLSADMLLPERVIFIGFLDGWGICSAGFVPVQEITESAKMSITRVSDVILIIFFIASSVYYLF